MKSFDSFTYFPYIFLILIGTVILLYLIMNNTPTFMDVAKERDFQIVTSTPLPENRLNSKGGEETSIFNKFHETLPPHLLQVNSDIIVKKDLFEKINTWVKFHPLCSHEFLNNTQLQKSITGLPDIITETGNLVNFLEASVLKLLCICAWLYKKGGVYIDPYAICDNPVNYILPENAEFVYCMKGDDIIFCASVAGNKILEYILNYISRKRHQLIIIKELLSEACEGSDFIKLELSGDIVRHGGKKLFHF